MLHLRAHIADTYHSYSFFSYRNTLQHDIVVRLGYADISALRKIFTFIWIEVIIRLRRVGIALACSYYLFLFLVPGIYTE